jgi:hypothetical protein
MHKKRGKGGREERKGKKEGKNGGRDGGREGKEGRKEGRKKLSFMTEPLWSLLLRVCLSQNYHPLVLCLM